MLGKGGTLERGNEGQHGLIVSGGRMCRYSRRGGKFLGGKRDSSNGRCPKVKGCERQIALSRLPPAKLPTKKKKKRKKGQNKGKEVATSTKEKIKPSV